MSDNVNVPKPCIGCGRPTLWRVGRASAPLCGRRSCGIGNRRQTLLDDWERRERSRVDASIIARADHITASPTHRTGDGKKTP